MGVAATLPELSEWTLTVMTDLYTLPLTATLNVHF